MNEIVLSGSTKLADIIEAEPRAMWLLPRFGIDLGVGDRTVAQACREKSIQVDFFILMVNVFLHPHYFPGTRLRHVDVSLLLRYLAGAHDCYIGEKVPSLQSLVGQFLFHLDQPARGQLDKFFRDYIREVIEHIEYEEQVVFPYIESMLRRLHGPPEHENGEEASTRRALPAREADRRAIEKQGILEFERRHNDIEEKLSDLKNLLVKYVPPAGDRYLRIRILRELIELEQDLTDHARLEDKVLIPIVEQLEKQQQSAG